MNEFVNILGVIVLLIIVGLCGAAIYVYAWFVTGSL